jgi:hypothetical protein
MKKSICCLAFLILTLSGTAITEAAAVRSGATAVAIATGTRGSAVAYDSVNHVYLVVSTFGMLHGRFVDTNGVPLGTPFVIQSSPHFTHFPTVTFSPDADGGAGGFLVVWHESDFPTLTSIHTRVVSFARSGPAGADTVLSVEGSFWEQYPAAAYSTASREFLVTWVKFGFGIRAMRVDNAGAAMSPAFTITQTNEFEGNPSVAYNPNANQFLVLWKGWNNPGNFGFVAARLVQAGTGQLVGATATLVHAGGGTYITDVAYNSQKNEFLALWYRDAGGPAKTTLGRVVNADGTLPGSVIAISSLWKSYDGLGLAYNSRTGTYFMVAHDGRGLATSVEDGGVEIDKHGIPVDNGFLVTSSPDGKPNYYPRIAAGTRDANWLVVAAHNFQWTASQIVAGTPDEETKKPDPKMSIDTPGNGLVQQPIWFAGWALDLGSSTDAGSDAVHVWAWPDSGGLPIFAGAVTPGSMSRPDVGAAYGSRFTNSGFGLLLNELPPGSYTLVGYMHSTVAGTFNHSQAVRVTIPAPLMSIDAPAANGVVSASGFHVGGWAVDRGATTGTGVDTLHMWAWPDSGPPIWAGVASYGAARADLGALMGAQFTNSGFNAIVTLPPGTYDLVIYSHSTVTGSFNTARSVRIVVQ